MHSSIKAYTGPLSSHCSPGSILRFPHGGGNVHEEVFILQLLHFNVPPINPKSVHADPPNAVPSHCSPLSNMLLPHFGFCMHLLVSIWQLPWQLKFPDANDRLL